MAGNNDKIMCGSVIDDWNCLNLYLFPTKRLYKALYIKKNKYCGCTDAPT